MGADLSVAKKMRIAGIVLILSVLGSLGISTVMPGDDLMTLEMLKLRAVIEHELPDMDMNSLDGILALQHHVYENIQVGHDTLNWSRPSQAYLKLIKGEAGLLCSGYTLAYMAALESQGIPARYVGLFSDDTNPYLSHATVEVFVGELDKWIAVDPTFGLTYLDGDGNYLNYAELWGMAQRDESWIENRNGYKFRPRSFDIEAVLHYVVIHPSQVWDGNQLQESELVLLPESWDGRIDDIDVRALGEPYPSLTGVLR